METLLRSSIILSESILSFKTRINHISLNRPEKSDYEFLFNFFEQVNRESDKIGKEASQEIKSWFNGLMDTTHSLFGFANIKPYGYAGDFEIISKFYAHHLSPDPVYRKWDSFIQSGVASKAVRNRKNYIKNLLLTLPQNAKVLNLASGPCTDINEFITETGRYDIQFLNLDMDAHAIAYAKAQLKNCPNKIEFINQNIFKFRSDEKFDLIWSAGLFDYFDDKTFGRIISRLEDNIKKEGQMVIGNFSLENKDKSIMEFVDWPLNHRSAEKLLMLGQRSTSLNATIGAEPMKVNLFLHLSAESFLDN